MRPALPVVTTSRLPRASRRCTQIASAGDDAERQADRSGEAVIGRREADQQIELRRQHGDLPGNADQRRNRELLDRDDEGQHVAEAIE